VARRYDVVGIGYAGMDQLCLVERLPVPGEKIRMQQYRMQGGGQTATALVALSRWGLQTAAVCAVGGDGLGRLIVTELEEDGVDTSAMVVRAGRDSQTSFVMVDQDSGERTIVVRRDPALELLEGDVDLGILERTRCLYLDGHEAAAPAAARRARELGVIVVLDCDRVLPFTEELLGLCDVVLCNATFPRAFTEAPAIRHQLLSLSGYDMDVLGMTLGDQGAVLLSGDRLLHSPAYPADVVDTTGAGDVFHAGYTWAYLDGQPEHRCLEFAGAAAAFKCEALGGRSGIPRDPDLIWQRVNARTARRD
jgi:sulfofructose kinase